MHLVDMITLLILLSLGPGYPIPGARISQDALKQEIYTIDYDVYIVKFLSIKRMQLGCHPQHPRHLKNHRCTRVSCRFTLAIQGISRCHTSRFADLYLHDCTFPAN
jgi:hypothetical protein